MKITNIERLNEVRHYIVTNFQDSCLAENYEDVEFKESEKDILVEELNKFFWLEYMNLCGCGSPTDCQEVIKRYLQVLKDWTDADTKSCSAIRANELYDTFNVKCVYDNPLLLFLAYVLDSYEFTEHGSGIGGAWITNLGRMYLDVLNEVDFNE